MPAPDACRERRQLPRRNPHRGDGMALPGNGHEWPGMPEPARTPAGYGFEHPIKRDKS